MTGPTRAPATLAADLAALSDPEREALATYLRRRGFVTFGALADVMNGVDMVLAHRAGHLVTLDAALDWVAEQFVDPEVVRLTEGQIADRYAAKTDASCVREAILAALRDRAAHVSRTDTAHDTEET